MKKITNHPVKITESSGNVFEDLGLENAKELFEESEREINNLLDKASDKHKVNLFVELMQSTTEEQNANP
jgi:hypothetical protein